MLFGHGAPFLATSVERCKEISDTIRGEKLDQHVLPGLAALLDDFADPDVDVPDAEFIRRTLKVFLDSREDSTYSQTLAKLGKGDEERIRRFVDNGEALSKVAEGFKVGPSLAAREELPSVPPPLLPSQPEPHTDAPIYVRIEDEIHALEKPTEAEPQALREDILKHQADGKKHIDLPPSARLFKGPDGLTPMFVEHNLKFENWGRTVENTPSITFVPTTVYDVQDIVKFAKTAQMNVRASGYRHSWSPIFGRNGQILISTLGIARSTELPNVEALPYSEQLFRETELNSIEFVGTPQKGQNRLVRVGTATTNQQFRQWCNNQKGGDLPSTLPLNVIMVEITMGGSNAPICHGAGRRHKTLSDLVYAIEYVDANGNLQKLSKEADAVLMRSASGSFGLLGVVTHLTLELEPMSYALLAPQKIPVMLAIPPPADLKESNIPKPLRMSLTNQQRAEAQAKFERRARDYFYSEWFWFPYTDEVWVNCWNTTDDPEGSINYPSDASVFLQFAQTISIEILQQSEAIFSLQKKLPAVQTFLISVLGLRAMADIDDDPSQKIKTNLPNALHFRRCIQNVRVRDVEIEIPLQPVSGRLQDAKFDDPIDFSTVQRAWWSAIITAYKHKSTSPQRMPLEMRITGPSDVTLAPYKGFNLGAASIEVLTLGNMKDEWIPYAQEVVDHWMNLKDKEGNYLPSRPHFAKEWYPFTVRGEKMIDYLRTSYKEALVEFRTHLEAIAAKQGWQVIEARKRFSNTLLEKLIFEQQ